MYGAGTWAHSPLNASYSVACSVSGMVFTPLNIIECAYHFLCGNVLLGTGEQIIRTSLARTLSEALSAARSDDAHEVIIATLEKFCRKSKNGTLVPPLLAPQIVLVANNANDSIGVCISDGDEEPNAGVLVLTREQIMEDEVPVQRRAYPPSRSIRSDSPPLDTLWCAFTTESMAVAYTSHTMRRPKVCEPGNHKLSSCG